MIPARIAWLRGLPRPVLWGHRGVRGSVVPENTLAAIAQAAEEGADGVEVDARPCASGELVVLHDATLARVTEGRDERAVAEVPYRELAALDLGAGAAPPVLAEVLAACHERRLCLNVELKADVPDQAVSAAAAARLLGPHDATHLLVVSCFDPLLLGRFRRHAPTVPVALLVDGSEPRGPLLDRLSLLGVHAVHAERSLVTRRRIRRWHGLGLRVHAWTVNDATEMAELVALGVDGIITDCPGALRAQVDRATERLIH